jgi:hypothetical protein
MAETDSVATASNARRLALMVGFVTATASGTLWTKLNHGDVSPDPAPAAQFRRAEAVPYNGKFTFTRIRYGSSSGSRRRSRSAWDQHYPEADLNMQAMLEEFTAVSANTGASNVFELEDRSIFEHPILLISEPGTWGLTDEGAANLREYLLKGGFLFFDDFEEEMWYNLAEQVTKALPEGRWVEIGPEHPVFDTFFYIENIYLPHPAYRLTPTYRAIFEDNDPEKRIMVLANHNSDLLEYWEYAGLGYFAVDPTNDAFRIGINYIVYGLTH